jgi:DNA-binding GntR family transcriptional regulator
MPMKSRSPRPRAAASSRTPVQRKTVAMLALEALREKILRGEYAEGAPLRQDALAAELGVSRIPIREALRQLEVEGLVTFSPHVGAVVSALSLGEIEELFELRAMIESDLLRRAMPRMDAQCIERAADTLDLYEEALREGDIGAWGEMNWQFHSAIYAPADRPLTLGIVQNLHNQSDRYLRMQLALTHGESRASEEHRAILEAVRAGSAQEASALLERHILGAGRSLGEFLREQRRG